MAKAGKTIFFISIVLLVRTIIGTIVFAVISGRSITGIEDSMQPINGSITIEHDGSYDFALYTDNAGQAFAMTDYCQVEGPSGPISNKGGEHLGMTINGEYYRSYGYYPAKEPGTYAVSCTPPAVHSQEIVGKSLSIAAVVGLVGIILAGVFVGLFFLLGAGLGLILWLVGRGRNKRATTGHPGQPGNPGQPGPNPGYNAPGYGG